MQDYLKSKVVEIIAAMETWAIQIKVTMVI